VLQVSVCHDVKVSLQSLSNGVSTSTWWSHGTNKDEVLYLHEWLLLGFSIIPTLVITELSQKLKRWLGSVCLLLWHVEIINENNKLLTNWWTEHTLSSFVQLLIKRILSLVGRCLCREGHGNGLVFFRHLIQESFSNVYRFSSTSWAWAEDELAVLDKEFQEELHSDRIKGWHQNFGVAHLSVNVEFWNSL